MLLCTDNEQLMKLECAGGAPLGICAFIYFHVLLCTSNEHMMKLACEGCGGSAPLGICSFMYFIVGGCILCAGDVCKWVCIEMSETWWGALKDFPYP